MNGSDDAASDGEGGLWQLSVGKRSRELPVAFVLLLTTAGNLEPFPGPLARANDGVVMPAVAAHDGWSFASEVDPLLREGRWSEAYQLAREQFEAASPADDTGARWAIILSAVILERNRTKQDDRVGIPADAGNGLSPLEPLDRVLQAYPDHPRASWLRFQARLARISLARPTELWVLAAPGDARLRLQSLAGLIESEEDLQSLRETVLAEITNLHERDAATAVIEPWLRLRDRIVVTLAELRLRRGEFFDEGSADSLAAAEGAERAATEGLELLPRDHPAHRELAWIRAEARRRLGDYLRAAELLEPLLASEAPLSDQAMALAVRIALDREDWEAARRWLDVSTNGEGEKPLPETDLARLRYLIQTRSSSLPGSRQEAEEGTSVSSRQVGDWIDEIGRRSGDLAKQRAATLALRWLGEELTGVTDERLWLAAAAAGIRAGKVTEVASRLDEAARRATDFQLGRTLGVAGAAAWVQTGRESMAASLLVEVAAAWPRDIGSPELLLQAAVLADRAGDQGLADRCLRQILEGEIGSPEVIAGARQRLARRRFDAGEPVEAAEIATPRGLGAAWAGGQGGIEISAAWAEAATWWAVATLAEPWLNLESGWQPQRLAALERTINELRPDGSHSDRQGLWWLVGFWGGLDPLRALGTDDLPPDQDWRGAFLGWLISERLGDGEHVSIAPEVLRSVPGVLRQAAIRRLVADGIEVPDRRRRLAMAIRSIGEGPEAGLADAQSLAWLGDDVAAGESLHRWLRGRSADEVPDALASAARVIKDSPRRQDREQALRYVEAALTRVAPGSEPWHRLQLEAIDLLRSLNRVPEAERRARFLTMVWASDDEARAAEYRRRAP